MRLKARSVVNMVLEEILTVHFSKGGAEGSEDQKGLWKEEMDIENCLIYRCKASHSRKLLFLTL